MKKNVSYYFTDFSLSAEILDYKNLKLIKLNSKVTQETAKDSCKKYKANLISIFTNEMQKKLQEFVKNKFKKRIWLSAEKVFFAIYCFYLRLLLNNVLCWKLN